MEVGVHRTREHEFPRGVYDLLSVARSQALPQYRDTPVLDAYVRPDQALPRQNGLPSQNDSIESAHRHPFPEERIESRQHSTVCAARSKPCGQSVHEQRWERTSGRRAYFGRKSGAGGDQGHGRGDALRRAARRDGARGLRRRGPKGRTPARGPVALRTATPGTGWGSGGRCSAATRRCVTLNLSKPEGQEIFERSRGTRTSWSRASGQAPSSGGTSATIASAR